MKVISRIYNGVSTEIDDLTAELCTSEMTSEPEYGDLASRIVISLINHKNTDNSFLNVIAKMYNHVDDKGMKNSRISDKVYKFIVKNRDIINEKINRS